MFCLFSHNERNSAAEPVNNKMSSIKDLLSWKSYCKALMKGSVIQVSISVCIILMFLPGCQRLYLGHLTILNVVGLF